VRALDGARAGKRVPQFAYMGADDDNDAVAYDDAYSAEERRAVFALLGARMQPDRWAAVLFQCRDAEPWDALAS